MVKEIIDHWYIWDSNRNLSLATKIVQFSIEDSGKGGGEGGDEGGGGVEGWDDAGGESGDVGSGDNRNKVE